MHVGRKVHSQHGSVSWNKEGEKLHMLLVIKTYRNTNHPVPKLRRRLFLLQKPDFFPGLASFARKQLNLGNQRLRKSAYNILRPNTRRETFPLFLWTSFPAIVLTERDKQIKNFFTPSVHSRAPLTHYSLPQIFSRRREQYYTPFPLLSFLSNPPLFFILSSLFLLFAYGKQKVVPPPPPSLPSSLSLFLPVCCNAVKNFWGRFERAQTERTEEGGKLSSSGNYGLPNIWSFIFLSWFGGTEFNANLWE